jgi:aspartate racemase
MLGSYAHPEVSLHTPSFASYVDCLERDDLQGVADLMLQSATKLAAIGADFLICPDNTLHQAFDLVRPHSPLPWIHIAEVAAAEAKRRRYRKVGILGTIWLVKSSVYVDALTTQGLEIMRPENEERDRINHIIMNELVHGDFKPASVGYFQQVIKRLKDRGCDSVVLGCTEIPLIINDQNSALPTLDSTRLLARAALTRAVYQV